MDRVSGFSLVSSFGEVEDKIHLLPNSGPPISFSVEYGVLLFLPEVDIIEGSKINRKGRKANVEFQEIFSKELQSNMCVYTDGSRIENSPFAGLAFVSHDGSVSYGFRTVGFVSSFCVEAMAILAAIDFGRNQGWEKLVIFSDSQSVLSAVGAPYDYCKSSYLILRIKEAIYRLKEERRMDVKLVWIPSHVGIQGNESADRLAREAIRTGRDTQYGIPTSEVSNVWKLNMYEDMFKWVKEEATRRGAWYCNNFLNESRCLV